MSTDKQVKQSLAKLERTFGEGVAFVVGNGRRVAVDSIPTGLPTLDYALGCGGIPRGRVTEVFGVEGGGKSTLALQVVGRCQAAGGRVLYVDTEHSLDERYAGNLGVRVKELILCQPDYAEQGLTVLETMIEDGAVDLAVVDSVAMLTPKAEIEGEIGDAQVGLQARIMAQALRRITPILKRTDAALVMLNQLRDKIGGFSWGSTETTPGGRSLRHMASVRIDVRRVGSLKLGEQIVGNRTRVYIAKNKLAPPYQEVQLDLYFGVGFSTETSLLDLAERYGVITRTSPQAPYTFAESKLGIGREQTRRGLLSDRALVEAIGKATADKIKANGAAQ